MILLLLGIVASCCPYPGGPGAPWHPLSQGPVSLSSRVYHLTVSASSSLSWLVATPLSWPSEPVAGGGSGLGATLRLGVLPVVRIKITTKLKTIETRATPLF